MYPLGNIIGELDCLAPTYLAEKWDNVGLLIGSRKQLIHKVLCALDINLEVIQEAIQGQADCIITHHPFIFKSIAKIDFDTPKGKMIELLIQNNISVYSMHTNWDIASGGINDLLSEKLELKSRMPLEVTHTENLCKLAVYMPKESLEVVRNVIIKHNNCTIGNYKGCTFAEEGMGSFVPLEGSQPYIGKQGVCELVEEVKLECMIYQKDVKTLIEKIASVHPYEEMAYDVYILDHIKQYEGIGRYGSIEPLTHRQLIDKIKAIFNIPYVRMSGEINEPIGHIAICSGSGSEYINRAAQVAQIYITGDVKFHEAQSAIEQGLVIIDVGHYPSENIAMPYLKQFISNKFPELEVRCSHVNGEVFQII